VVSSRQSSDGTMPTPSECVGPIAIPPGLMGTLYSLAKAAGADGLAPLLICATELASRLSRQDAPRCARVIGGAREAVTPGPAGPPDPAISFRQALRRAAEYRPAESGSASVPDAVVNYPVDVTILVSPESDRLYAESMTNSAGAPDRSVLGPDVPAPADLRRQRSRRADGRPPADR
jgi:hypothetical protein